jgi:aspartate carbamoyltransferase catalytic subunit
MPRSIISIDDLTIDEMEAIFQLADRFLEEMRTPGRPHCISGKSELASKHILATLFFEASTRTRLSFESAMLRLGGTCLSSADGNQTSASKGETIADTVRVVESYADIMVIRHPLEGAARIAADFAAVPVINAGDGSHEHPTQTLCDLYTLRAAQFEKGRPRSIHSIRDLNVVIWGDLLNGRTVHSLVYALARLKARIIPRAAPGFELPEHVANRLAQDYHCVPLTKDNIADDEMPPDVDVVYLTPDEPHQLALFDVSQRTQVKGLKTVDALYSTRLQLERLASGFAGNYPAVDSQFLKQKPYRDANVMHPLPRVDELSYDIDEDKRSMYFKQAAYGVPVRMALIASLLELVPTFANLPKPAKRYEPYSQPRGIECSNPKCISRSPAERRYLKSRFHLIQESPPTLRCAFCDVEQLPQAVGSAASQKYSADLAGWREIVASERVFFADEAQALAEGYAPRKSPKPKKAAAEV